MASPFSLAPLRRTGSMLRNFGTRTWTRYRGLKKWQQLALAVLLAVLVVGGLVTLSRLGGSAEVADTTPTVTVDSIADVSGNASTVGVLGNVRSVTEASIISEAGGVVKSVHTQLGANVPAGFVIAELDNASQRAAVLQAEGAYEGALAAQAGASPKDVAASALNTYTASYNSLDSTLKTYVDAFYGEPGAFGPKFLISPNPYDFNYFSQKRAALTQAMNVWHAHLAGASSQNAPQLLDEADTVTRQAAALVTDIATAATKYNTDANATQLAALASARANVASIQASITAAQSANQSQNSAATAGVAASVKSALGTLRAAQANLEKTLVRAPISGQVNFLPIRVGDYVSPLSHVATVAQNNALEIVAYVSEDARAELSVGQKVTVEDKYPAVITSIAPALDPVTKQIEVHVGVTGTTDLVNGQSVHVALPAGATTSVASSTTLMLPLTALKLTPSSRVVFSVGPDGTLVGHAVEIGDVRGDRIEIRTPLPPDLRIVTDARGLSEGQKVNIAPAQ